MILGHEFAGIVEEIAKRVKNLKKANRAIAPFQIVCRNCFSATVNFLEIAIKNACHIFRTQGTGLRESGFIVLIKKLSEIRPCDITISHFTIINGG